jgi:hypothetical protein
LPVTRLVGSSVRRRRCCGVAGARSDSVDKVGERSRAGARGDRGLLTMSSLVA